MIKGRTVVGLTMHDLESFNELLVKAGVEQLKAMAASCYFELHKRGVEITSLMPDRDKLLMEENKQ